MRVAGKIWLYALIFYLPCTSVVAADDGRNLARIALAAKQQNAAPPMPWIGDMRISDKTTSNIRLADGANLMKRPDVVRVTTQTTTVDHDVSHFYKPEKLQLNLVMHYAGRQAGEIISFGFDSGFSAEKLKVKPALFVGYTRAFQVAKSTHISVGMGGWFGGKVSHKPCHSEGLPEHKFYCQTVIPWSDYQRYSRQHSERLQRYYNITWTHVF